MHTEQQLPGSAPVSNQQYNHALQEPAAGPSSTSMQHPGVMLPSPALPSMPRVPSAPGFIPVSTSSQQPVAAQEPRSPHAAGNASASSFTPPPTVQTAHISNISAEMKPVVSTTLTRLFDDTSAFLGGARAPPAKKREIEDNSRKLGALFVKLNSADLSANASTKPGQLRQAFDAGDYASAMQIQVGLTTSDWNECGFWLAALNV